MEPFVQLNNVKTKNLAAGVLDDMLQGHKMYFAVEVFIVKKPTS